VSDIVEITMDYWKNEKINCARSTAAGILKYNNDDSIDALKSALIPFGGGIRGKGKSCGALVGTLASMSKILADRGMENDKLNEKIDCLIAVFEDKHGSMDCHSILSEFKQVDDVIDYDHPDRKPKCTSIVSSIVVEAQKILDK
jgi:C_GCAxxG_C_C family probable redox protein